MRTGLHGKGESQRFEPSTTRRTELGVLPILSRMGLVADECRWNYIASNDVVAGSNPVRSNTMGR